MEKFSLFVNQILASKRVNAKFYVALNTNRSFVSGFFVEQSAFLLHDGVHDFIVQGNNHMTIKPLINSITFAAAFALAGTCLMATPAHADQLLIEKVHSDASVPVPRRGMSKSQVQARFGEPNSMSPAVGGNKRQHPPITRWHYQGFTVYFEHNHVINSVVHSSDPVAP